jgi:HEPN domain-containing protein
MPPEPGSPADWLRFAESDLDVAKARGGPRVLPEMLCFHAQQAVEKSLKAVLLAKQVEFPKTHNLKVLLDLIPPTVPPPPEADCTAALSDYAVSSRYPGEYEPVSEEEYQEAVRLADAAVAWAQALLHSARNGP